MRRVMSIRVKSCRLETRWDVMIKRAVAVKGNTLLSLLTAEQSQGPSSLYPLSDNLSVSNS